MLPNIMLIPLFKKIGNVNHHHHYYLNYLVFLCTLCKSLYGIN